jgi:hypothetical protein
MDIRQVTVQSCTNGNSGHMGMYPDLKTGGEVVSLLVERGGSSGR